MNYDNVIGKLMLKFPDLKKQLKDPENDYLEGLPHCVFDIIVIPYIVEACENNNHEILNGMSDFLEEMALCEDEKVGEVLSVSFLEPVVLAERNRIVGMLESVLKEKTLKELEHWKEVYLSENEVCRE